ncbi:MAG: DUF1800 family protein [Bauldia sp.]
MAVDSDLFFARRLGLGLRPGETLKGPPRDWAMEQVRSAPALDFYGPDGTNLFDKLPPFAKPDESFETASREWEVYRTKLDALEAASRKMSNQEFQDRNWKEIVFPYMRAPVWRDVLVKTLTAVNGPSPVFERFWMFWCNHFVIAVQDTEIKLFWGPHGRAIRNRMTGKFADLLYDAIANPGMLMYLNNDISTGPHSDAARRETENNDLNENLGRELLELHTISPAANYTQDDVREVALILTGWQMYAGAITNGGRKAKIPYGVRFNPYRHEPGDRTVMGKVYKAKGKGENLLRELIDDLAVHPATAKFLALKLARAFIADDPPQDSVDAIATAFSQSGGDMIAVHSVVIEEVIAKAPQYPKFTTPDQWLLESYRTTGAPVPLNEPNGSLESLPWTLKELGQALEGCPQPDGYSALKSDWLSKELLDRRVRQAYRIGSTVRNLTVEALTEYTGRLAGTDSPLTRLVQRAESEAVAVAYLLASPQFLKT